MMIMINYREKAWCVNPIHIQFTISIIKKNDDNQSNVHLVTV